MRTMMRKYTSTDQDEVTLAVRQLQTLVEKDWRAITWMHSDFVDVQQPFHNVRIRLVQALDLSAKNQKLKADVPAMHAGLKFVGLNFIASVG